MAAPWIEKWVPERIRKYFSLSRSHFFGLLLVTIILIIYETSSAQLELAARNSAELLVKRVLWFIGLRYDWSLWIAYAILLLAVYWSARRQQQIGYKIVYFPTAIIEGLFYGLFLGGLVNLFSHRFTIRVFGLSAQAETPEALTGKMTLALGAGIYEELVFRLGLVSALLFLFKYLLKAKPIIRNSLALVIAAALFAGFHYMGGREELTADSFFFRFYAGIVLGVIFLLRGIGIASYTHAFYDLFFLLRSH